MALRPLVDQLTALSFSDTKTFEQSILFRTLLGYVLTYLAVYLE